jgi:hypothetical protein
MRIFHTELIINSSSQNGHIYPVDKSGDKGLDLLEIKRLNYCRTRYGVLSSVCHPNRSNDIIAEE